ncbi:MAG: hypothetical protein ACHP9Y_02050 [Gammaproteobacteria bacterium]
MIMKKYDVFNVDLDAEEQEITKALDQDKHKSVDDLEEKIAFAKEAAVNYLRKDARVNIRISSHDLTLLKQRAAYKGLLYQTFIASILHEYAAGHFIEAAH